MSNLTTISTKLIDATEDYGVKYPTHIALELKYLQKYDKSLLTANSNYGTQALRESATREAMRLEPEYEAYMISLAEIKVLEIRIRSLTQISKNLVSGNWSNE